MKAKVVAYTEHNNKYEWIVETIAQGREYAKRIISEGLWVRELDDIEVFYPVDKVFKVKVVPESSQYYNKRAANVEGYGEQVDENL